MSTRGPSTRARVITFYSFKGGTGRTMALANAAWILATNGKRVLAIDWDLEAPGLHHYFGGLLSDPELEETDGLVDFLFDFVVDAADPAERSVEREGWFMSFASTLQDYVIPVRVLFEGGGYLHLVGAGRQGPGYAERVNMFDWRGFYERFGGSRFIDASLEHLRSEYDYILVDSRTGVSDTAGICTVQIPDCLALFFTLNDQSIEGAASVARSVARQRGTPSLEGSASDPPLTPRPPIQIWPVPSRIDLGEHDKLDARRALVREQFTELLESQQAGFDAHAYLDAAEILYISRYSYGEELATLWDAPRTRNSLLSAFEHLTGRISNGAVQQLGAVDESLRRELRERISKVETGRSERAVARRPVVTASPSFDVFVSHDGRDKPVVESLCRTMLAAGIRPWLDTWDLAPGIEWSTGARRAIGDVRAVLLCVGPHGPSHRRLSDGQAEIDALLSSSSALIVPVLLPGASELPDSFRDRQWIDLTREESWGPSIAQLAAAIEAERPRGTETDQRPYRGLKPFTEADAGWMFGREHEATDLLDTLRRGDRFIAVVGASGSGKSSLVRAGVIPAVRTGAVDDHPWHVIVMRPGARPRETLADELLGLVRSAASGGRVQHFLDSDRGVMDAVRSIPELEDDGRLLIVIDQFEELFTVPGHLDDEDTGSRQGESFVAGRPLAPNASAFLDDLLVATDSREENVRVILTVRADFMGECLRVSQLAPRMKQLHLTLVPMAAEQLRDAIRLPAHRIGYRVEEALVDVLVSETEDQPGRLPLLQHTLDRLWDARDPASRTLTYASYQEIGSLEESLETQAEQVYREFVFGSEDDATKKAIAVRRVFLRLVHLGEGTGDTRRQVLLDEFLDDAEASAVIDAFIDARLLVIDDYRGATGGRVGHAIEVSHEALLGWGRLRRWLDENRAMLRMRQEASHAAEEWARRGRQSEELWRGGRLEQAWEKLIEGGVVLSQDERQFLERSREEERHVREQEDSRLRRRQRIATTAAILFSVSFVIFLVSFVIALWQWSIARSLADENNELAAQRESEAKRAWAATHREQGVRAEMLAGIAGRSLDALQLAVRAAGAAKEVDGVLPEEVLRGLNAALASARRQVVLKVDERRIESIAWHPGGDLLATSSQGGTVRVWESESGVVKSELEGVVGTALAWRPDGSRLAIVGLDADITLWSPAGDVVAVLGGHTTGIGALAWAPDGTRLATGGLDGTIRVWDGATGESLGVLASGAAIRALAWAPDGSVLAAGQTDRTVVMWDGASEGALRRFDDHQDWVTGLAWDPSRDGLLAALGRDGRVRLHRAEADESSTDLDGLGRGFDSLAWAPEGSRLALGGRDGHVECWSVRSSERCFDSSVGPGRIVAVRWSPDGVRLATMSDDGAVRLLSGENGEPLAVLDPRSERGGHDDHEPQQPDPEGSDWREHDGTRTVEWNPAGSRLAANRDNTVRIWDVDVVGSSLTRDENLERGCEVLVGSIGAVVLEEETRRVCGLPSEERAASR